MIVYEVYTGTLTDNGVESSLDMLSNSYVDKNSFEMAYRINDWLTYNTLLYGFFRTMIGANRSFHEPVDQDGNHYITGGGYVESDFRKNPLKDEPVGIWKLTPKQVKALKENIAFIKKRKIPYILVQAPITQKLYSARTNNKQVDSLLFHLGIYKNFYGSIPLNDTVDFYDSDHMNQDAVVKFNEEFIRYLKSVKIEK
ncbi:hypothetical protein [Riemerella columbipharyngis]|uniref:Uncharacterized protein n=1 Tax=Riemerella columbipharyngis TaxID=1071918 RepID=A0A1G7EC85_9FLAO|nr:hypothetical protein [Riemerella columbipharyngis]SDE61238.1 hypothetical protein SAMN05421544_11518 [Riemerella columbipharyngis]